MMSLPYGPEPPNELMLTRNLQFVELLHDPHIPRFKSNERGRDDEKNRAVMVGILAL